MGCVCQVQMIKRNSDYSEEINELKTNCCQSIVPRWIWPTPSLGHEYGCVCAGDTSTYGRMYQERVRKKKYMQVKK